MQLSVVDGVFSVVEDYSYQYVICEAEINSLVLLFIEGAL